MTSKEISTEPELKSLSPLEMASIAMQRGDDISQIKIFLDLNDRLEAKESKKNYIIAMALFKSESIEILKDKAVYHGAVFKYNHATLGKIIEIVVPYLSKHGFSHSWNPIQKDGQLTVQCIMTHKDGHSETVEMFGLPDASGGKNPIQALVSTKSYLERTTFTAICGLASKDQDDDGQASGNKKEETPTDEKINYTKVKAAADFFKSEIDKDNFDNYKTVHAAWERLNQNEQMKVFDSLFQQVPDSKKKYKNILSEYLKYAPNN